MACSGTGENTGQLARLLERKEAFIFGYPLEDVIFCLCYYFILLLRK